MNNELNNAIFYYQNQVSKEKDPKAKAFYKDFLNELNLLNTKINDTQNFSYELNDMKEQHLQNSILALQARLQQEHNLYKEFITKLNNLKNL